MDRKQRPLRLERVKRVSVKGSERSRQRKRLEGHEPEAEQAPVRLATVTRMHPSSALPTIWREGVTWRRRGKKVEIAIKLMNASKQRTEPGRLVVEAALFGAFQPWQPLATLDVPALEPGARRRLGFEVDFSALPQIPSAKVQGLRFPDAFPDEVTSRRWAGNLNVWFESRPEDAIEMHRALDLYVPEGEGAFVLVMVPEATFASEREFDFEVSSTNGAWKANLVLPRSDGECTDQRCVALTVLAPRAEPAWLQLLEPNASAPDSRAPVTVFVTRRSDGRRVQVDFEFSTTPGAPEDLGCIQVGG